MIPFTQECASYCPSLTAIKSKYGPFEVELVDTVSTENANVTVRELKFRKSNRVSYDSTTSYHVVKYHDLRLVCDPKAKLAAYCLTQALLLLSFFIVELRQIWHIVA